MEYTLIEWEKIYQSARNNMAWLVFNSEFNFDFQVQKIAEDVYNNKDIKIIAVAGPSASGKTTFSKLLKARLEYMGVKTFHIELDNYFIDRKNLQMLPSGVLDFDSPNAVDFQRLKNDLRSIMKGRRVAIPKFDFITGTRVKSEEFVELNPNDVLILEGIHAHNGLTFGDDEKLLAVTKKVFIAPMRAIKFTDGVILSPAKIRLIRRILRDLRTRGHSVDSTLKQWNEVRNAENKYIFPYLQKADYQVDSLYDYELFVYKKTLYYPLQDIKDDRVAIIKKCFSLVDAMPLPIIPSTSLINEFIGEQVSI